jgi:5S rRNA maturation endonuclease (ribonuclease M5)
MSKGANKTVQWVDYEIYIQLESIIREMNDGVDSIVVEGVRDKEAMQRIGFTKEILLYSGSKFSDVDFVDYIRSRYKSVAIMTDYDREGKKLNQKLCLRLERGGVRVEKIYRDKIGTILAICGMKSIESLNSFMKKVFREVCPI